MPATLTAVATDTPDPRMVCRTDAVTWDPTIEGPDCWACGRQGVLDVVIDIEEGRVITLVSAPVRPAPDVTMERAETHFFIGPHPAA